MKPESIDDLAPAPYNPRHIDEAAADGLRESLSRYGDISGITWNQRTGNLVTGHQRVVQLRKLGATFEVDAHGVRLRAGDSVWAVRVVDLDESEERAANVSANNPHISGRFTDELDALLGELSQSMKPQDFASLKLDALVVPEPKMSIPDEKEVHLPSEDDLENECPKCGYRY